MKTKEIFPWNVKVGDVLVMGGPYGGESNSEIIAIQKGRAHFFRATKWTFVVKEPMYMTREFRYYGKFMAQGLQHEAEKVKILKK